MNRRGFLTTLAAGTSAVAVEAGRPRHSRQAAKNTDAIGQVLPLRELGRTGKRVTMLGVGGFHVGWTTERDAAEIIETALEGGIRFFDTAESYGPGTSETRFGKYLTPRYRKEIFLMTKTTAKDAQSVREHLEGSLERLKTDYLDLWQIHALSSPEDVETRLANGVLEAVMEAKASGLVRHIGFTGHSNPEALLRVLELTRDTDPFDACQIPVNVIDPSYHSFIDQVIPEIRARKMGLLAMKTLADGRFFGVKPMNERIVWRTDDPAIPKRISVRDALHFVWALPVSVLITGAENASLLREKIDLAKSFEGMSHDQRQALVARMADLADGKVEYYKRPLGA